MSGHRVRPSYKKVSLMILSTRWTPLILEPNTEDSKASISPGFWTTVQNNTPPWPSLPYAPHAVTGPYVRKKQTLIALITEILRFICYSIWRYPTPITVYHLKDIQIKLLLIDKFVFIYERLSHLYTCQTSFDSFKRFNIN